MTYEPITFHSGGVACSAWRFRAADDRLATEAGRPIVVMAHGLGGTKDSGLESFATGLAAGGVDVLAFDYRGFGTSGGEPRQIASAAMQQDDYRAALFAASALPGVDPTRLVLWGVSLAGGHVLAVGADRPDVAAIIALTPLVDGMAAARHALPAHSKSVLARSSALGVRAKIAAARGAAPVTMPLVAPHGEVGALSLPGLYEDYLSIAGPSWRNEIGAQIIMELSGYRPGRAARRITCPVLMQIGDFDRSAPPHAAARVAERARAEVRHYPCDHFDVHAGKPWHEPAIAHELLFLQRVLAPERARVAP